MSQPDPRRGVPRTDVLLATPELSAAIDRLGRQAVKQVVADVQQLVRAGALSADHAVSEVLSRLPAGASSLTPVLNATGVVLHTNLGRAGLSEAAVDAVVAAAGYVDVEFDLASGGRTARGAGALAALRAAVPDAEDVLVVNNGAAALVLATTTLAAGREVIVSRGELVEIGDGFRLPDLIRSTGARLREVGTTNRTHLADYRDAITEHTGAILKVHPSNFRLSGYTGSVELSELSALGPPVIADIGSGLLAPDAALPAEPDARTSLRAGAGVVTASGDKLLGGPQAGLVLGRADLIARLRRHPLARALRVDKLTLAALEASVAGPPTPTYRYLHAGAEELRVRTERLSFELGVSLVPSAGTVGGGGAPGSELPGWALVLPEWMAEPLRRGRPAVVGRVEHGHCLLDLRCVPPERDPDLLAAVRAALAQGPERQASAAQTVPSTEWLPAVPTPEAARGRPDR